MKLRILFLVFALFRSSLALSASDEHLGILTFKEDQYKYLPLFTFSSSSWAQANAEEQKTQISYAYFDGKTLGSIKVGSKACTLNTPPSPKAVSKFKWLKKNKIPQILTAISNQDIKDPDLWKPYKGKDSRVSKESLDAATSKLEIFCYKFNEKTRTKDQAGRPEYDYAKTYSTAEKNRFLVRADKTCPESDSQQALYVWLYTDSAGQWKHLEANELIDIGDFDSNGTSEALFSGVPEVPQNVYLLVSVKGLDILAQGRFSDDEETASPCP